jgi:hypothetical protein
MTIPRTDSLPVDPDAWPSPSNGEVWRLGRALRTLSAGNRTLLRATDEGELLKAMCRVIVEEGGYRLASVRFAMHDEHQSLRLAACAFAADSDPEAEPLFRTLFLSWGDNEFGQSAAGVAVRSGQACIGRNLLTEPGMAPQGGAAWGSRCRPVCTPASVEERPNHERSCHDKDHEGCSRTRV